MLPNMYCYSGALAINTMFDIPWRAIGMVGLSRHFGFTVYGQFGVVVVFYAIFWRL